MKTSSKGYKINPWIFRGAVLFLLLIAVFYLVKYGNSYTPYVNCEGFSNCENPILKAKVTNLLGMEYKINCPWEWCTLEELPPGEYGEKPPLILKLFFPLSLIIVGLAFLINHFFYNKGRRFHIDIPKFLTKLKEIKE